MPLLEFHISSMLLECNENKLVKICTLEETKEKQAVDKFLSTQLKELQEVEKTFLNKN
jgi:hypothetical protein